MPVTAQTGADHQRSISLEPEQGTRDGVGLAHLELAGLPLSIPQSQSERQQDARQEERDCQCDVHGNQEREERGKGHRSVGPCGL